MHHVGNDAAVRNVKKNNKGIVEVPYTCGSGDKIHQQYKKTSKRSLSIFRLRFFIIFLFFFTRIFFAKLQLRKNQTG